MSIKTKPTKHKRKNKNQVFHLRRPTSPALTSRVSASKQETARGRGRCDEHLQELAVTHPELGGPRASRCFGRCGHGFQGKEDDFSGWCQVIYTIYNILRLIYFFQIKPFWVLDAAFQLTEDICFERLVNHQLDFALLVMFMLGAFFMKAVLCCKAPRSFRFQSLSRLGL